MTNMIDEDEDEKLQQWLDAQPSLEKEKPAFKLPTWEQMKYNFQVQLYAKAIGVE